MPTVDSIQPRLVVNDADGAISFYSSALGARELARFTDDEGRIVHAELDIDGMVITLKDAADGDPAPPQLGGTPVIFTLRVDDPDTLAERMVRAGASVIYPVADRPYGNRDGRLADPYGHVWMVSRQVEALDASEVQQRVDEMHQH
ncbi:VOC family protein [Haloechinothrix sp. LS1_15]|uniref:VOC family protein n=1 Tax=Haloechinothrix sp. LS1_15 TaxID=2652248 RepID=UPI00294401B1|nr:VOC family protein [Haloechinothrix sp. LS1_15]MDV6012482.1 VOC family protein [Haloechinothrix sp. LS1_15]